MILAIVRHAESVENADKYNGFYHDRRPYSGQAAHDISRNVVGLTPRGFRQSLWLGQVLSEVVGPRPRVYTSQYRRAIDTALVAFPDLPDGWPRRTELLDEQHYGDATYMTKPELFATYPDGADDRRLRKHLWTPPGGECLAEGVWARVVEFTAMIRGESGSSSPIVAVTHQTTILALRALLEARPIDEVVAEARKIKTPTAGVLRYELRDGESAKPDVVAPAISE